MNVDDLQQVFHDRADEASRVVLDVDAIVRKGTAVWRRRMVGAVLVVVVALAAGIVLPITLTRATGSSASLTPVASPAGPSISLAPPSPQVTQFPCAVRFLVGYGSYPTPTEFVKPVTQARMTTRARLMVTLAVRRRRYGEGRRAIRAEPREDARTRVPDAVEGALHVSDLSRPAWAWASSYVHLSGGCYRLYAMGPSDTPFFYSTSNEATNLTNLGQPL